MRKKNIELIIVFLLLLAFLMAGCDPAPGGGNNGVVPIVVTFDAQGGAVSPASKEVTAGSAYGELPVPTKIEYNFLGWFTEKTGGTKVTSTTKVTNTKSHTLYAQWEEFVGPQKTVTVTFNPQGGTVSTTSKEVTVGSTYGELPTPTRWEHTFQGWFTAPTGGTKVTETTKVTNTQDHTLYAQWNYYGPKQVTVTFDAMGGTPTPAPITVKVGSVYGTLPTPTRWEHTFQGWFTAPTGGTKVTETTKVTNTQDHTLYAHWKHF